MKPLIDSNILAMHRARASQEGLFLHDLMRDELHDRLNMVKRTFKSPAIISGFPQYWADSLNEPLCVLDHETLQLSSGAHDLIFHALSLHWSNDPVGQLIQCRRALCADGLLLVASFGGETLSELRSCLGQAEIELNNGLSPRVAPMGEIRDLGGLLQRAGLALPVADVQRLNIVYKDIWHLMHDLRAMGETNVLCSRMKTNTSRRLFERANALYQENFQAPQGGINATFEIIHLSGWAPDASQAKPLRPGSASARLADALNTNETILPE